MIKQAHGDPVIVRDSLELYNPNDNSRIVSGPRIKDEAPQIVGFFTCVMRERGKLVPGSRREGQNIWTLSGREYLAQLMSYGLSGSPTTPFRNDRIQYMGFGTGTQPEVDSVTALITPTAATTGIFLAAVGIPTFPLSPARTTVRYTHTYTELELSILGTVTLSEAGLFTDGSPTAGYSPGTRDTTIGNALLQPPQAYKIFEPLKKTQNFILEVNWEIRF